MGVPLIAISAARLPLSSAMRRRSAWGAGAVALIGSDRPSASTMQAMDAVVVIGGCDKTLPAQVMAAASTDLPTVVLPTGPMVVGHHRGQV
ncbi:MAG TPA: dihydroxy-acid dehydratase, partial [Terracidiphilus sp.]|nr:dihydroxy-acid dehydratase [Terracidiphilus sp.]